MSNQTYIGLHPNNLNRTNYGEVVLYVEGVPVAFFSGSGDVTISGSLAIEGITNVSASIAAAGNDTGSLMVTGSVSGDTITFTKGDGTTFQVTINNVASASYATVALSASFASNALSASFATNTLSASFASTAQSASFASSTLSASFASTALSASLANNALSASFATTAISASYAATASNVSITNDTGTNAIRYLTFGDTESFTSGNDNLKASTNLSFLPLTSTLSTNTFSGALQGTASYASFAATASRALTMSFDGNRAVTQPLLPDLVNYNPGTSTVVDFLNQVFYPDPGFGINILSNEPFYLLETELSGSHVRGTTVSGTPPERYYWMYGTASFSSNQNFITWSLQPNTVLDINPVTGRLFTKVTLSGSAIYQAPSTVSGTVIATATGGGFATKAFTVTILDNEAPSIEAAGVSVFSPKASGYVTASGAVVGFVTISENRDPVGPPTISSIGGVDAAKFSLAQTSQTPSSTTYDVVTTQGLTSGSYSINFTGSDVHGQITTSTASFTVSANNPPSLFVQTPFSVLVQNVSSGSEYGRITVSNDTGDLLDTFTLSGADAGDFAVQRVSIQTDTLGSYGQATSIAYTQVWAINFATAPQVKSYDITASATDNYPFASYTGSLAIANAVSASAPGVFSPNGTFYIIESAVSGALVTTVSSGIAGNQARLTTNQPVSWSIDDPTGNLFISGSTIGFLSMVGTLSGSAYQNGNVLVADVTATNTFNQTRTQTISVNITDNVPATITTTAVSQNNYNTVSGRTAGFGTVTVLDPQGFENVQLIGIGGPAGSSFVTSSESPGLSVVYKISSSVDLNSGSYVVGYTASDSYGQLTYATQTYTVTANQAPNIQFYDPSFLSLPFGYSVDISLALSGSQLGNIIASDGDSGIDGITSFALTGSDATKFAISQSNEIVGGFNYVFTIAENLTAGSYNLSGSAVDGFGNTTIEPIPVTVTVDAPSIPTPNGQFYIIESAVSGSDVTTASSGIAGTKAKFTTNQTVTWSLQSGAVLAISQSGELSIKVPMSGSAVYLPGSIIADRVIATNQFNSSENFDFQVLVTDDLPPVITDTLADKNNNKTTTATGFGTITVSDPQSLGNVSITDFNGPNVSDFTFTAGPAGSTRVYTVSSSAALNSGSYSFSVTASDAYAQTTAEAFTINVIQNLAPTVTLSGFSRDLTGAVNGATVGSASIADPQDDSIVSFTLSGTDSSKFATNLVSSTATTALYRVTTTQNLTTGSYNLTGSATDSFGLTTVTPIPVTVTSTAPAVPIQNALNFYIIESALSGSNVVVNNDGFTGTQADMNADQPVTWSIKSPSTYLAIDSNGGLSVKTNISGSAKNASGAPFNLISEYVVATNAVGGSSEALVNVQVTANAAPEFSYTGLVVNEGSADAGDTVGTVTATDPQSLDSITSIIISGGANAGSFELVETGATSYTKSYNINVSGSNLAAGSYGIELTGRDSFNKTITETKTVVVNSVATTFPVYTYINTISKTNLNNTETNALAALGAQFYESFNYANPGFPLDQWISGSIGSSITAGDGVATATVSGSVSTLLNIKNLGTITQNAAGSQPVFLFPSASGLPSLPETMYLGSDFSLMPAGEHALITYATTPPAVTTAGVFYFTTNAPFNGHTRWGVVYGLTAATGTNEWTIAASGETLP